MEFLIQRFLVLDREPLELPLEDETERAASEQDPEYVDFFQLPPLGTVDEVEPVRVSYPDYANEPEPAANSIPESTPSTTRSKSQRKRDRRKAARARQQRP